MAGDDVPEVGDKVSWNWNGSAPGGQVAEKKTEGEVAIQSKRGNTIKKDAKPGDPAIHLERPGNDVVKNQSELQVDEKNAGADDSKQGDKSEETSNGTNGNKRKAEDQPEAEGGGDEKAPPSAKKAKAGKPKATEKKEKATPKKKEEKPKAADKDGGADGEKKARGRPKGSGAGEKKAKKPPAPPTGVGKRTRSNR